MRLVIVALIGLVVCACAPSSGSREHYLRSTASIEWTEEQRLNAGNQVCDFLDEWRAEWHEDLGEPMYLAFEDLTTMAINAGATGDQANALHGSAVEFLCPEPLYREAWREWVNTSG